VLHLPRSKWLPPRRPNQLRSYSVLIILVRFLKKPLRRELKRCKKCLVFSGADVVLQVQCGTETCLIRTDILDKIRDSRLAPSPMTLMSCGQIFAVSGTGENSAFQAQLIMSQSLCFGRCNRCLIGRNISHRGAWRRFLLASRLEFGRLRNPLPSRLEKTI
jgi:hypothetical protein